MQPEELKRKVNNIRIWRRGDERAPHKPLVLLYSLGCILRGGPRLILYEEVEDRLRDLLIEFGPYRQQYEPAYPFVRLCNDQLWELEGEKVLQTRKDWSSRELIENRTRGGFPVEIHNLLKRDRRLLYELVIMILNDYFDDTLHQEILGQVGIEQVYLVQNDLKTERTVLSPRSPDFRDRVLRAYEYRCAVCGFDVRLGNILVAVEAAHIKWHCYGGPDQEENGIALCSLHHKLFDKGAFTLDQALVLRVAEQAHGTSGFEEWLLRYHGKVLRYPQNPAYYPKDKYINWHVKEVFRGPSRYIFEK